MNKKNEIIKYADMEAPIKTISGRYHRATRKIKYTDHKLMMTPVRPRLLNMINDFVLLRF